MPAYVVMVVHDSYDGTGTPVSVHDTVDEAFHEAFKLPYGDVDVYEMYVNVRAALHKPLRVLKIRDGQSV
jgi:hypothetical protein